MTNPTSTQTYEPGDIVVVFVPYKNQPKPGDKPPPGTIEYNGLLGKRRPMVIASVAKHNKVEDLHVAQITTQVEKARQRGEYVMKRWNEAHVGLKHESAIRPRVEHIVRDDVIMRVGTMHPDDRAGLAATMKDLFGIQ